MAARYSRRVGPHSRAARPGERDAPDLRGLRQRRPLDLIRRPPHHPIMDRRRFLLTSLAGVLATPLAGEAQQAGKVYRIGMLWNTPNPPMEDVLRQGLRDLGWIEGQNFNFERRYSEGRDDRHPALAAELVRLQPDLIITAGTPAALATMAATTTIPVVFGPSATPWGLVSSTASLDRVGISREPVVQARSSLANG